jgi:hypothetical protein
MTALKEPPESKLAAKAWAAGEHDVGRYLYRISVEKAHAEGSVLPPSFYLSEWARMEGTIGNREAFEALHHEALALEPNAPFLRLCYARDLWTEFKDGAASLREIEVIEELLSSGRWDQSGDLTPMAYAQKVETLRAWINGEPGGPLWP